MKTIKRAFVAVSVIAILAIVVFYFLGNKRSQVLKAEGNRLIGLVEEYRDSNGRLPENLGEIGVAESLEGPLYYQKLDSVNYLMWFGTDLGESITYSSVTKEWN